MRTILSTGIAVVILSGIIIAHKGKAMMKDEEVTHVSSINYGVDLIDEIRAGLVDTEERVRQSIARIKINDKTDFLEYRESFPYTITELLQEFSDCIESKTYNRSDAIAGRFNIFVQYAIPLIDNLSPDQRLVVECTLISIVNELTK